MLPIVPKPVKEEIFSTKTYDYDLSIARELTDDSIPKSGYQLTIDDFGITIKASDADGFYYAKVTLQNLKDMGDLPNCEVLDYPTTSMSSQHSHSRMVTTPRLTLLHRRL